MSYNTQETSEIGVSSKIDRTALTETLSQTVEGNQHMSVAFEILLIHSM